MAGAVLDKSLVLYSLTEEQLNEYEESIGKSKKRITKLLLTLTFSGTAAAVIVSNTIPANLAHHGVEVEKTIPENHIKVKSEIAVYSPETYGEQFYTKEGKELVGTVKESQAKILNDSLNRPIAAEAINDISTIGVKNGKFNPFVRYEVNKGDKAYAPGDGKVVKLTDSSITIKHKEDDITYFTETTGVTADIKVNDTIKKGDTLGKVTSDVVKFAVAEKFDGKVLYEFIHPNLAVDIQKSDHLNYETGKVEKVKTISKEAIEKVLPPITNKATKEQREVVSKLPYGDKILRYSDKYDMDPVLIAALIKQESDFNPNAKSGAEAKGLMQFMDDTAPDWGVTNPYDPDQSIDGGVRYLKSLIKYFDGDVVSALYGYNWGMGNVRALINKGITPTENSLGNKKMWEDIKLEHWPTTETQDYAPGIIGNYREFLKESNNKATDSSTVEAKSESKTNDSSTIADTVLKEAAKHEGAKYQWGASVNRTDEFDCSSLTLRAFKAAGIDLPRTSREQSQMGTPVSLDKLKKGDLLFFDTDKDGVINHVGIYNGNNTMINASSKGVSYATLKGNSYWGPKLVKAVRISKDSVTASSTKVAGRNQIGNLMANLQKTGLNKMKYDLNYEDWLVVADSGVDLKNVNPELLKRISAVAKHYGKKITINSGYRTFEQQKVLYDAYKSGRSSVEAAKPGNSRHNYGLAIDVDDWVQQISEADLKQFGLHKPVSSENWHVEPLETKGETPTNLKEHSTDKEADDTSKKDEQKANKSEENSKGESKDKKSKDVPKGDAQTEKLEETPKEKNNEKKLDNSSKEETKDKKSEDVLKGENTDNKSKQTPDKNKDDEKSEIPSSEEKSKPESDKKDDKKGGKSAEQPSADDNSSSTTSNLSGTKAELDQQRQADFNDEAHPFIYGKFFNQ